MEKQLLAYVFFRHYLRASTMSASGEDMDWVQTFEDLAVERTVTIYVDQPPCRDCMQCVTTFIEVTKIMVDISVDGESWRG